VLYSKGKTLNPMNQKEKVTMHFMQLENVRHNQVLCMTLFPKADVTHKFQQRKPKDTTGWSLIYNFLSRIHCINQKYYEGIS
jgi:hypothetical protein